MGSSKRIKLIILPHSSANVDEMTAQEPSAKEIGSHVMGQKYEVILADASLQVVAIAQEEYRLAFQVGME